jgi:hypothetical protein|mmetsp:Transcript_87050/g.145251  ORF Transcript_87050/g.145251 Transcript_87050/m.145251 type:complete len:176 (+) Transcript_87050:513-1040(+)
MVRGRIPNDTAVPCRKIVAPPQRTPVAGGVGGMGTDSCRGGTLRSQSQGRGGLFALLQPSAWACTGLPLRDICLRHCLLLLVGVGEVGAQYNGPNNGGCEPTDGSRTRMKAKGQQLAAEEIQPRTDTTAQTRDDGAVSAAADVQHRGQPPVIPPSGDPLGLDRTRSDSLRPSAPG